MNNTRQILKIKINDSAEEINKYINNYLKQNTFVQTDYNGEKVLKHNSLIAKQNFFNTYLKFHISENELTVVGWINYKDVEYGFDDTLDFEDKAKESNWKPTKDLYNMILSFASSFKSDDNIVCQKVSSNEATIPNISNYFNTDIEWKEEKPKSVAVASIVFIVISIFIYIVALSSSTADANYVWVHFIPYAFATLFSFIAILKIFKKRNHDKQAKIVFYTSIILTIIYLVSATINFIANI